MKKKKNQKDKKKKSPQAGALANQKTIYLENKTSDIYIIKSQLQSKSAAEERRSFPSIITELNIIFQSPADCKWGLWLIQEPFYHWSY